MEEVQNVYVTNFTKIHINVIRLIKAIEILINRIWRTLFTFCIPNNVLSLFPCNLLTLPFTVNNFGWKYDYEVSFYFNKNTTFHHFSIM